MELNGISTTTKLEIEIPQCTWNCAEIESESGADLVPSSTFQGHSDCTHQVLGPSLHQMSAQIAVCDVTAPNVVYIVFRRKKWE